MNRKIIFLDIDGTLTEPGHAEPPVSALEAIRRVQEVGHFVFLCTGRNYAMLKPLLKYGFDGVIASAGGYVLCDGKVIFDCPMTEKQQKRVMDFLKERGIFRTAECLHASYSDEGFKQFLRKADGDGENSEFRRWQEIEKALGIHPMSEYGGEPIYKIIAMCENEAPIQEAKRALSDEFDLVVQDAFGPGVANGELINRKFHKGKAVEMVCSYLGIPLEDSIGFGDSMNDKEMLETVGFGVCMANGCEGLKAVADEICPSVSEDGLKKELEKLGLFKRV